MRLTAYDVGSEWLTLPPTVGAAGSPFGHEDSTMHGLIHLQLQRFVESQHGPEGWRELNRRAGFENRVITALQSYPDEDLTRLVAEAVGLTGVPAADLLEAFGQFLAPVYLSVYGSLLKAEWRTLDLLENTERTIHRVVRVRQPGAAPPVISVERTSDTEVLVTYGSQRRLCAVARGIIRGVAAHYQEPVRITERTCMLRGGDACRISVRLQP